MNTKFEVEVDNKFDHTLDRIIVERARAPRKHTTFILLLLAFIAFCLAIIVARSF